MQRTIQTKPNARSPTKKSSITYYQIPINDLEIIFIDSMPDYNRLLDRLFPTNNENEHLYIGFDC